MNNKLSQILSIVAAFLALIGVFFYIRVVSQGDQALKDSIDLQYSIIVPFVNYSLFLLVATVVITVLFSVVNLFKQPQVANKSLISLSILIVLLLISYLSASDSQVMDGLGVKVLAEQGTGVSKWVGTLITYGFILAIVAIAFVVIDFVKSLVKQ